MPNLGKGMEIVKLLLSQISPDMRQSIAPMLFPALGANLCDVMFLYPDQTYKPVCGMVGHLIGDSGIGKGQLGTIVKAILRDAIEHDRNEFAKLLDWTDTVKSMPSNRKKPQRPELCFWFPPANITNPAFIQNAMACEKEDGHTQYFNLPEVEMADTICGGHRSVSKMIRNIFDSETGGSLRATADGVSGNPVMRVNMNLSSTPYAGRQFYKNELFNGTLGRIMMSFKPRNGRSGKIPRQGLYDDGFAEKVDKFVLRLQTCRGRFIVPKLNRIAQHLAEEMTAYADLIDDDIFWDMSKRAIINAWKCGCILYILNEQTWTTAMGNFVEWLAYHDMWSKMQVFGDMLKGGDKSSSEVGRSGPQNMLDLLPDTFSEAQLEAVRESLDKDRNAKGQLKVWASRGLVTYSSQTGMYSKTEKYLSKRK